MKSARSSTDRHCEAHVEPFPVRRVASVKARPENHKWLVESLWLASGVGILGGAPKVGKTFLAAEIAVAVAAGDQALGCPARMSGPVLFYGAEDDLPDLSVTARRYSAGPPGTMARTRPRPHWARARSIPDRPARENRPAADQDTSRWCRNFPSFA